MSSSSFISKLNLFLPLLFFLLLVGIMKTGLQLDPGKIPSPLIGKTAPAFTLPVLGVSDTSFSSSDMLGRIWLLNIWASWCAACVAEHPLLERFLQHDITIVGLNYKDQPDQAIRWLVKYGDPYYISLVDANGDAGLDWGVYGVPETFLIDQLGTVRHKHIGPLSEIDINDTILPQIRELQQGAAK